MLQDLAGAECAGSWTRLTACVFIIVLHCMCTVQTASIVLVMNLCLVWCERELIEPRGPPGDSAVNCRTLCLHQGRGNPTTDG
jgi:hypothetical protein